ncbi:MAG: hypothetical protein ABI867_29365 [Kofleriaceae bacterium]
MARVTASVVLLAAVACGGDPPPPVSSTPPALADDDHERELAVLGAFEDRRRGETDFAVLPPADAVLGPDPYRIGSLRDGTRIGLLRGDSAVVALAADGAERSRIASPRSPSGMAISSTGDVLVVGDGGRDLAQYRASAGTLARTGTIDTGILGMRDVALSPDGATAYVVEEREGRLLAMTLDHKAFRSEGIRELGRCHGPIQVEAIAGYVVTNCLLDHTLEIRRDARPVARIHHDGPFWSFALHREPDGSLVVAAGGIEDHPLVREDGGFGYIDSFVYVYRLAATAAEPVKLAAINTSALGTVMPKWIAIRASGERGISVTTAGYASANLLALHWRDRTFTGEPEVTHTELPPGTAAAELDDDGTIVAANPLLDAWVVRRAGTTATLPITSARPPRSMKSRVGELLFFTTMMAPWNSSEGKLSRFTCEACHYEGYVDGRTHFTGRLTGDVKVHATSRPLYGLFNNAPHFSRALDKTMTQMVHAEFRVANRHNGRDPWFGLARAELPWLATIGAPAQLTPELLRESFMSFLMDFSHRANPAAQDRTQFTELERAGAGAFRDRCAGCHAARLVANDPRSLVAFERWEALVLSPAGPIVWSDARYAKTGIEPYVHDDGARVPPLRRLYKKWPYFTNGSGRSLTEVLEHYRHDGAKGYHAGTTGTALTRAEQTALLAFLELL